MRKIPCWAAGHCHITILPRPTPTLTALQLILADSNKKSKRIMQLHDYSCRQRLIRISLSCAGHKKLQWCRRIDIIFEICKGETFFAQKAEPATTNDFSVTQNLLDILTAHKDSCIGMAGNMIGVNKCIIAFDNEGEYMVMFNHVIVKQSGLYEAKEGCLSLAAYKAFSAHLRFNGRREIPSTA